MELIPELYAALRSRYAAVVDDYDPSPNRAVIVVTKHFRCLGYIGFDQQWRQLYTDEPIPKSEVIGWQDM